jgi:hypothetical protein
VDRGSEFASSLLANDGVKQGTSQVLPYATAGLEMASSILESAPVQAATKAGLDAATNVMKSPLVRAVRLWWFGAHTEIVSGCLTDRLHPHGPH